MPHRFHLIHILVAVMACACSGSDDAAVPRRHAYPRPVMLDTVYAAVDSLPVRFLVNKSAYVASRPGSGGSRGVDIVYTQYGATVYCTFTPVTADDFKAVADNRLERIYLNISGAKSDVDWLLNEAGFMTMLVSAPAAKSTPIQFLAFDENEPRLVVSGAVFFHNVNQDSSTDSIAPMVYSIGRDIRKALDNLENL